MAMMFFGDAKEEILKLSDHSVDLVHIDVPYDCHALAGGEKLTGVGAKLGQTKELTENNITNGYDMEFFCEQFRRICRNGLNVQIWVSKKQIMPHLNLYVNKYGYNYNILCLHKSNPLPTYNKKYLTDTEWCLNFFTPGKVDPKTYEDAFTYYTTTLYHPEKKEWKHPTIKPLEFVEKMIRNSTKPGDVVLDCFMGSGTTGVACVKNNRDFYGIEINKEWFDIAQKRISEATSSQAGAVNNILKKLKYLPLDWCYQCVELNVKAKNKKNKDEVLEFGWDFIQDARKAKQWYTYMPEGFCLVVDPMELDYAGKESLVKDIVEPLVIDNIEYGFKKKSRVWKVEADEKQLRIYFEIV